MQEALEARDPVIRWILRLVDENSDISGKGSARKVLAIEEPQVSSHMTRIYKVDDVAINVKFFSRTLGRTNITYNPVKEMVKEFSILREYENMGFTSGQYQVVRPLGTCAELDCALATIYVEGKSLQSIIYDVAKNSHSPGDLYRGLNLTAGLLKKIHTIMPRTPGIDRSDMFFSYLKSILYLEEQDVLNGYHRRILKGLTKWYNYKPLYEQRGVTVHGDANPSNFKIKGNTIYAFDMERSLPGRSIALDLGTMAAELKHQFSYLARSGAEAEPYISHFLHAYAPDEKEFDYVTGILPFYMSQSLFKIAMLGYWRPDYKRYLIEEGTRCIEVVPR